MKACPLGGGNPVLEFIKPAYHDFEDKSINIEVGDSSHCPMSAEGGEAGSE